MANYAEFYEARSIVTQILETDLIGPVEECEILSELPTQYYVMGKLYPQNNFFDETDEAQNPILECANDDYDASISLSNQFNPSSMAITLILKAGVESILLSGSYAFYKPTGQVKGKKTLWYREPHTFSEKFSFAEDKFINLTDGLQIQVYSHSIMDNGERIVK